MPTCTGLLVLDVQRVSIVVHYVPRRDIVLSSEARSLSDRCSHPPRSSLQALRVVMVMGVLEGGFLIYNSLQDRFEGKEKGREGTSDAKTSLT